MTPEQSLAQGERVVRISYHRRMYGLGEVGTTSSLNKRRGGGALMGGTALQQSEKSIDRTTCMGCHVIDDRFMFMHRHAPYTCSLCSPCRALIIDH